MNAPLMKETISQWQSSVGWFNLVVGTFGSLDLAEAAQAVAGLVPDRAVVHVL